MLQGPQRAAPERRKRKKKNDNTRNRAQTYNYNPTRNGNGNGNKNGFNVNNNNVDNTKQAQTDDLLDLFGYDDNTNNNNDNNTNNNNNVNPFDDMFGFDNNNAANNNNKNNKNNNNEMNETEKISSPKSNGKKKSKKKNKKKTRAATVSNTKETANVNYNKYIPKNNNNQQQQQKQQQQQQAAAAKPARKMKKIDVLPLLHKGIRANKFKLNGNKSKVRTFFLTDNNFYFCWEAVGIQKKEKGGLFSKKGDKPNRSKIDKDRSIPIRSIRSLQKNPAYMMQSYNFIPSQQKALTISIVYSINGQDKKLNFMAYEAFHHQLFHQGLQQLIAAARDPKRNLSEVFELYVDFPKEILPKHLRPQRFKWEPLGDSDYISQNEDNKSNDDNVNNSYFDDDTINNIDVYDPTTHGQYGRSRIKSF